LIVPFIIFLSKHLRNDFFIAFVALISILAVLLFLKVGYLF
jgi:hypothetical protein